ncbi:MAG TPA: hypothetical protein PLL20_09025 [Phycisphaerae bacterium]|nr:hypothetical protein [Phycisphaerae bacterium]HRR86826.1 hypothetical protein [Phycisphaerae bacterium]
MSKLKEWLLIGMVALVGAASLGSDCNFTLRGDEDGIRFDVDDDDDDLEDLFDDIKDLFD